MLKNLKNKDSKKQAKKESSKKNPKEQKKVDQQVDQQQSTDLVDVSELKQDQGKVKQNPRKKNDYQLQEKVIDVSNLNLNSTKVQKPRITWAANSVQEVMRKEFKMEQIDHEFISLTDEKLNQQLLVKQKEEEEKKKNAPTTFQNNLNLQALEKTPDQLKMEKADGTMQFSQNTSNGEISNSGQTAKSFINTNFSEQTNFKPIEKTAQQIKMEEMQKKQQQIAATQKTSSWLGGKKANDATTDQKPMVFKTSAWVSMATENQNSQIGANIKFAPLNPNEIKKQTTSKKQEQKIEPKKGGWAVNNIQEVNGMKFAPLQTSKQDEKMKQSQRKQQQFVYVSKKEIEQRKKRKQEKEKQLVNKEQPKV